MPITNLQGVKHLVKSPIRKNLHEESFAAKFIRHTAYCVVGLLLLVLVTTIVVV